MDDDRTKTLADEIRTYEWAVFTSPSGVEVFFEAIEKIGLDTRVFWDVKVAAVGKATADELKGHGIKADLCPQKYSGESLGAELAGKVTGKVILLRADKCGSGLTDKLDEAGIEYTDFALYRTEYECVNNITDEINCGNIGFVTFTSASTVRAFMAAHPDADINRFTGVCIGEQTAAEAERFGINYIVSDEAVIDSMAEGMADFVRKQGDR